MEQTTANENSLKDRESTTNKKILLIKIPAQIKNKEKAIELLGGKKAIISKNLKNENLELKLFLKSLPLEKCISNDILIKKKTKRNKKNPLITKTEYEIVGRVSNQYEYFSLHDFVYYNKMSSNVQIDDLQKFAISKEEFIKELEKLNSEQNTIDLNNLSLSQNEKIFSQTQKSKAIHNLQERKNVQTGYSTIELEEVLPFFQPNHIANIRYSYPKKFKELYDVFNLDKIKK